MFVVNKNKILIVLMIFFIILLILNLLKIKYQGKKVVQTVSLPVSGKTVVLDAGHGYPDERRGKQKWNN